MIAASDNADRLHLRRALGLARRGRFTTAPNPMVGCVITDARGTVVGEGWHRAAGGPHAEVFALEQAAAAARGGTAYVSLEPCNHHGRTPPCSEALIAAGIARVVACHGDPHPAAAGGLERLRQAGIEVAWAARDLGLRAAQLNWRFLVAAACARPAVTIKWAASLDGKIATAGGESQWISSPPARRWALAQRESHDAIVVGSGTALADDPRLDRRLGGAGRPNLRAVLDRRLRLPAAARMLDLPGPVLIYAGHDAVCGRHGAARRRALEARGATIVAAADPSPRFVLSDLYQRGVHSLLVEGGGEVIDAFVAAGLFDRVCAVAAPILIGGRQAPGPVGGGGTGPLATAPRLEDVSVARRGDDLIIKGFRAGCLPALYASVGL